MKASLRRFSLPLRTPLETSSGPIDRREGLLVRVAGEGVVGVGEATPLPGWTEDREECEERLAAAVDRLGAAGPGDALRALDGSPAARHGLALALADRAARAGGNPLYRRLGAGGSVRSVPVNAVVGEGDVRETVAAASRAATAGFPALKVKVGARAVDADARRLAAVRDAVGPDVTIRADANGAWTRSEARAAFEAFAEVGVAYVEQPLDATDLAGHRDLRGGPVAVAVDETLASVAPGTVVGEDAADVLVVKPMVLGGLDRARSALSRAANAGLAAVVTTTVDGAVARTGAVHLAASVGDPAPAGLATAARLAEDVADDPAPVADGRIAVPQSAGHGVRVEGWSS